MLEGGTRLPQVALKSYIYLAGTVGVLDSNQVKVLPFKDEEADDRVGIGFDGIVHKDNLDIWIDVPSPGALAVHSGTSSTVIVGLVL